MKYLTLILLISIIGCATYSPPKYNTQIYFLDLREASKKYGIMITTGDLSADYESIGVLEVACYDGVTDKKTTPKPYSEDDLYNPSLRNNDNYRLCNRIEMIDQLASKAKEVGANCIIKFEYFSTYNTTANQTGITIRGLAIKLQ